MFAQQRGKASFYSKRATGARTASGARLHHDSLTCAHRTYPFGTLLKVRNPANGCEVIVKVTDRGPFSRGRIIDLSWGAAKALGMLAQGVCMVEVEKVSGRGVPYREEEDLSLPAIDFELGEAGYSFIDAWKERATEIPKISELPKTQPTNSKAKYAGTSAAGTALRPQARQQAAGRAKARDRGVAKVPHAAQAQAEGKGVADKKTSGNIWESVFDKVKHWGDDWFD